MEYDEAKTIQTNEVNMHRWLLPVLALSLALSACSRARDLGDRCDPEASECKEGYVCDPDGEGSGVCAIPYGDPCDPDDDPDYCQGEAACVTVEDDEETPARCYVPRGVECSPDEAHCAPDLSCAEKTDGTYACFEPVVFRGLVFDSDTTEGIEGAHVLAMDEEKSAASDIAVSDADGVYELEVPVVRDDEGNPTKDIFTLRASAQDYQTFPGGIRTSLPIDASTASESDGMWLIESALTEISLILLPENERGRPAISGEIVAETRTDGVLVVAESGGVGYSGVSDRSGAYTIFNVPAGTHTVRGYAADVQLEPEEVEVEDEHVTGVDLHESENGLATVTGNIQIVNAPGGSATTVVLVVASTFDQVFERGEVPSGLRAPRTGEPNVTGDFTIENVPAGEYVVLAAFENDDLVRDPDTNIGGTEIVSVTVPADATTVTLEQSFKVTEALDVISPGSSEPEAVTQAPTLRWQDDSSEDRYVVRVFNAYGEVVWEDEMVPSVSGSEEVSVQYGGPLESGMYYQFRATSWRKSGNKAAPISTTEDLKGVFFVE